MRISDTSCGAWANGICPLARPSICWAKPSKVCKNRTRLHRNRVDHQLTGHVGGQRIGQRHVPPLQRHRKLPRRLGHFRQHRRDEPQRPAGVLAGQLQVVEHRAARQVDLGRLRPPAESTATAATCRRSLPHRPAQTSAVPSFSTALTAPRLHVDAVHVGPLPVHRRLADHLLHAGQRRRGPRRPTTAATKRATDLVPRSRLPGRHRDATAAPAVPSRPRPGPRASTSGVCDRLVILPLILRFDRGCGQLPAADLQLRRWPGRNRAPPPR